MAAASGLAVLPGVRRAAAPDSASATGATSLGTGELIRAALDAGLPADHPRRRRQRQHRRRRRRPAGPRRPAPRRRRPRAAARRRRPRPAGPDRLLRLRLRGWTTPASSWPATSTTRCSAPRAPPRSSARRRAPPRRTWQHSTPPWPTLWRCSRPRIGPRARQGRAALRAPVRPAGWATPPSRYWRPPAGRASTSSSNSPGWRTRLAGADLVITGEGSLDEQSLLGKTPMGVARAAARAGVPVVAVCGRTTLTPEQQHGFRIPRRSTR